MGFDTSTGVYTGPAGSTDAAPGDVIRSATWNTINASFAAALTQLGQQAFVNGPRVVASGSFSVAVTDNVVFVQGNSPTIVFPLSSTKVGPVGIFGASGSVFGSNSAVLVGTAGETFSGVSRVTLSTNWQVVFMYPIPTGGGYIAKL